MFLATAYGRGPPKRAPWSSQRYVRAAGSLAGFTFAPDGKIYFTDKVAGRVLRIDPQ
jgi:hypothetical protein